MGKREEVVCLRNGKKVMLFLDSKGSVQTVSCPDYKINLFTKRCFGPGNCQDRCDFIDR